MTLMVTVDGRSTVVALCCCLVMCWTAVALRPLGCTKPAAGPTNIGPNKSNEVCSGTIFPYVAALVGSNVEQCNGVIVSRDTILAPASCFDRDVNARSLEMYPSAVIGSAEMIENIEDIPKSQIFATCAQVLHPNYTGILREGYDLAILKLASKLPEDLSIKIFPINGTVKSEDLRRIARFRECKGSYTRLRVEPTLEEIDVGECVSVSNLTKSNKKQDNILCTKGVVSSDQDTAIGGVLIVDGETAKNDMLVGLSSIDPFRPCGDNKLIPVGFTRMTFFIDWINEMIAKTKFDADNVNPMEPKCNGFKM